MIPFEALAKNGSSRPMRKPSISGWIFHYWQLLNMSKPTFFRLSLSKTLHCYRMWQEKNNTLYRKFTFDDFVEAFGFMSEVAELAEAAQHHPEWRNVYNEVEIWLTTHDKGSVVTKKDHDLAMKIDQAHEQLSKNNAKATAKVGDESHDDGLVRPTKVLLYADGGSRGNPGPSATGYVLFDDQANILQQSGEYLGITTNNQAEYQAVKLGLEKAKQLGARYVDVYLDSLLVVNQMKGVYKVKNRDLWPIHEAIKDLREHFQEVKFTHVPRELNKLADAEVNKVLDAQKKQ